MNNLRPCPRPIRIVGMAILETLQFVFYLSFGIFMVWALFCSFDVNPPIKSLQIDVKDAKPGGVAEATYYFIRERQCAVKTTTIITDSKGVTVHSQSSERSVNGALGFTQRNFDFKIDEEANPGKANLSLYLSWECPYNIVHSLIKPITAEYRATLNIKKD